MGRNGYSEDCEHIELYRGTVARAIRGKRGQALLRDALAALDAMPVKRLIADLMEDGDDVCLLGAIGRHRQIPGVMTIDPGAHRTLAEKFDVARQLIQEIESINDDDFGWSGETPELRFSRMRRWIVENLA